MSAASITISEPYRDRYEALLRATHAIASCDDCDRAGDVLLKALLDVVPFDYLHLVAFEPESHIVEWHLLYSNGRKLDLPLTEVVVENTPAELVHNSQQILVTGDWREEGRFAKYGEFLSERGIASTCSLPLVRGERRLGVLSIGSSRLHAYPSDEVQFLSLVAGQIALSIDAAVNFYLSRRAQDRLTTILDLTNQVVSNLDFHDLLRSISASVAG